MIRIFLLSLIIVLPFHLFAQSENQVDQLSAERSAIIKKMDSLEIRLVEIDDLLTTLKPEDKLKAMTSKYGKNKGKMIANGKVWNSISTEMALDSWGEPEKVQRTELSSGSTEKWSYPEGRYLFFKNGRLEGWKE